MKKLKNISKLINLMSQHYTNSMDEICVPVIKKILGHYLATVDDKDIEEYENYINSVENQDSIY